MDPFLAPEALPATADDGSRNSPCIGIVMNTLSLLPAGAAEGPGDDDEDDDSPETGGGGGGNIDPDDDDYGDDEDDDDDDEDPLWAMSRADTDRPVRCAAASRGTMRPVRRFCEFLTIARCTRHSQGDRIIGF